MQSYWESSPYLWHRYGKKFSSGSIKWWNPKETKNIMSRGIESQSFKKSLSINPLASGKIYFSLCEFLCLKCLFGQESTRNNQLKGEDWKW